jgi:hypothetical protein
MIEVLQQSNHILGETGLIIKFNRIKGYFERTFELMKEFLECEWIADNCDF